MKVDLSRPDSPGSSFERHISKLDPRVDGWDTEAFNDAAAGALKALSSFLEQTGELNPGALRPFITDDFACQPLRPAKLKPIFDDGAFVVSAAEDPLEISLKPAEGDRRGADGLLASLKELAAAWGPPQDAHAKLKQFTVEKSGDALVTRIYFEGSNHGAEGSVQQNATWRCHWALAGAGSEPRLQWLGVEQYNEVRLKSRGGRMFVDVTRSAIGRNKCYEQDILPGINHWLANISRLQGISRFGHHGIALGDVNNDGLEDLYFCNAGGLPNHLFIQDADGTVTDQASAWGVDWLENSPAALIVDLDNDGWQDLVVAGAPRILFCQNDRRGHFNIRWTMSVVSDPYTISGADFDNDGDLDIYVCSYMPVSSTERFFSPVPYHDANNGGRNALFRNDGNFQFPDVTEQVGLDENNRRFSFASSWEDYDDDGWIDLYVANDFGRNNLYRNDHGRFRDVAAQAGVEDIGSGMSVNWGDFNRDGRMDIYVANMFSSAGNRVTYQRKFAQSQSGQAVKHLQRMARGNTLFRNSGDGTFVDVSEEATVTMGRWAWASKFADVNNDGWPDILIANGYVTGDAPNDL